ncbi:hypothetical protein [Mycobacterium sp. URHB0021]|jgi:hypothetical protein
MSNHPPGWYPAMSNDWREFLRDVATVALILAVYALDYGVIRPRKAKRACTRTGPGRPRPPYSPLPVRGSAAPVGPMC